jgi:hypothetical protein
MKQSVRSFVRSLWNRDPKYRGLQIMTIGFLGAVTGAGVTLLGGVIRDASEIPQLLGYAAMLVLYLGWSLLILGAVAMCAGVLMHWISLIQGGNRG